MKKDIQTFIKTADLVTKIILINVAIFLILNIINVICILFNYDNFFSDAGNWLSLRSNLKSLLFKPWTLITHMFTHFDLFHILFNMLTLFFAGKIFVEYLNEKRFLAVYILGGLFGALLYIIAFNIFPKFQGAYATSTALGASAAVLSVLTAAAMYVPQYTVQLLFFGRVKLIYIALVLIALDIINFPKGNFGGHIAHIGGAAFGAFYIFQYKKGKDLSLGFTRLMDKLAKLLSFNKSEKLKVAYKRKVSDEEYNLSKIEQQKKIDAILDKISKSGYESLTKKEKEILFNMSNKKF